MCLVDVCWISELCFLANNVGQNYILFEQKYLQLFRFAYARIAIIRIDLCAQQRTMQKQFTLCRYFAFEFLQSTNVHLKNYNQNSFLEELTLKHKHVKALPCHWLP